jgi:UDP-N-acetyl-D-glucosamine dehydrogenase
MRNYKLDLKSVPVTADSLGRYDLVLIATNHDAFDYDMIREHARLVVDTRGVYREPLPNVVRA